MGRGAWWALVHGVSRVRHNLATKLPALPMPLRTIHVVTNGRICFFFFLMLNNPKECSNYRTIALIAHASKVMLKILQARLQQYVNRKLPDVQAGFRKGRGTRDQIANIHWIIKKAREF